MALAHTEQAEQSPSSSQNVESTTLSLRKGPSALVERIEVDRRRRLAMPSNTTIARFLSASLGGALVGSIVSPLTLLGALLGAACGAGVVMLRTRHAH